MFVAEDPPLAYAFEQALMYAAVHLYRPVLAPERLLFLESEGDETTDDPGQGVEEAQ